jgi:hypothetical protein
MIKQKKNEGSPGMLQPCTLGREGDVMKKNEGSPGMLQPCTRGREGDVMKKNEGSPGMLQPCTLGREGDVMKVCNEALYFTQLHTAHSTYTPRRFLNKWPQET